MPRALSESLNRFSLSRCQAHNKQLQRTVTRRRGDGASAPFHYALAPRVTPQRAAAELRRYAP
jgi:hypothetical protein